MKKVPVMIRGIVRWIDEDTFNARSATAHPAPPVRTLLVREAIGFTLRELRLSKGKTLRQTSTQAQVALGYLSEVERAHKEASSEIIASICEALDIPLSTFLLKVSDKIAATEPAVVPDTIPAEMFDEVLSGAGSAR